MLGPATTTTEKRRRAPKKHTALRWGVKWGDLDLWGAGAGAEQEQEHELLWGLSGEAVHGIRGLYSAEEG
ncbi:hypothetical protein Syun_013458 [Stephania yunnanensis]|uniref:Uncharacterized protein n=1 Tax=Stephania yunnanensis TaxID=152371 RepID=A0AAP0JHG7_9MAGN